MGRNYSGLEIAIIGMAGRFPGASDIKEFWKNLKNGIETVSFLSKKEIKKYKTQPEFLNNPNFVPVLGGELKNKQYFDASFFNYSPPEAEIMDPQFRLFHECSWHALEDAGYVPDSYDGEIGIYAGASSNLDWIARVLHSNPFDLLGELSVQTLTDKDFLASRVSYCLNLKGPVVGVQTACSTSLSSVHLACRALLTGECDIALAGGVRINTSSSAGYLYQEGMFDSIDGHCRAFDSHANGSIGGNGIGVVVLKRLKNAITHGDNIHAVILGSALNNDGNRKVGFAAPSIEARSYVIKKALHVARVELDSITYIEAQGIATSHGDAIELDALKQAFDTDRKNFCALGSVKTNIGHLDAAAGVAGLIKTILALKNQLIPPCLHFESPNPHLGLENSPFYVNTNLMKWENSQYPLRAGVSCFGIGGTNVHIVLENFLQPEEIPGIKKEQLILLSAKSRNALEKATNNLSAHFKENCHINLADAAYTLQVGRKAFSHRGVLVAKEINNAVEILNSLDSPALHTSFTQQENPPLVFIFSNEGTQYVEMGLGLYRTVPIFREYMDGCFKILESFFGFNIRDILYPSLGHNVIEQRIQDINQKKAAGLHAFIFEYALAKMLLKWGIKPYGMVGHGIGEYVAACLSQTISPEEALKSIVLEKKLTCYTSPALENYFEVESTIFLELGPGEKLSTYIREHKNRKENQAVLTLVPPAGGNVPDYYFLLEKMGELWLYGTPIAWKEFYTGANRRRISMPLYPFEGHRYWLEENSVYIDKHGSISAPEQRQEPDVVNGGQNIILSKQRPVLSTSFSPPESLIEQKIVHQWQRFFGIEAIGIKDSFFELGGDSLKAVTMISIIHKEFDVKIPLMEFFDRPTISKLGEYIKNTEKKLYYSIEPVEKKEYYPFSPAQKRLYIIHQMDKGSINYNMFTSVELEAEFDFQELQENFLKIIDRHESFRTSFELIDNNPVQRVYDEVEFNIEYDELNKREELKRYIKDFVNPFDLSKAPLIRLGLLKINEGNPHHILILDMHHIISDGVSQGILVKELLSLYNEENLSPLKLQYKDFSQWQNGEKQKKSLKSQEEFWLKEFSGEIPALNLPKDFPRALSNRWSGNIVRFKLSQEQTRGLNKLISNTASTLYLVLLGIANIFLSKLCNQEDIIIGTPTAGRMHGDLENILGMFVNTLALRNYPFAEKKFQSFLTDVKEKTLRAFENQNYPFEDLVDKVVPYRNAGRNPLFDVMFSLDISDDRNALLPSQNSLFDEIIRRTTKFDLTLSVKRTGKNLYIDIGYDTGLFKKETIQKYTLLFKRIISQVVENPEIKIFDLEILPDDEKIKILNNFNDTRSAYPKGKMVHQLFEEQAEISPDSIAICDVPHELTYNEINKRSNILAIILRGQGVKYNTITAIMVERSPEMPIGVLGIWKSGGAYLPIAMDYPQDRIKYMLIDSNVKVLLSHWTKDSIEKIGYREQLSIVDIPQSIRYKSETLPSVYKNHNSYPASNISYVIYTSGTTGNPKGVPVSHNALVNRLYFMQDRYNYNKDDVFLQKAFFSFDVSVSELTRWILGGGKTILLPKDHEKDPDKIARAIQNHRVTVIGFLPSMLSVFLDYLENNQAASRVSSLKWVFVGAETVFPNTVKKLKDILNKAELNNTYGPTETTIDVTHYDCLQGVKEVPRNIPIGRPISNVKIYIMDQYHHLLPIGIPGELCIAGKCLALGYLNNPELTSIYFITPKRTNSSSKQTNEKESIKHFYRTGDLARWLSDGNIELTGRRDHQIKIRGFRIELAEIEAQLSKNKNINKAVVIVTIEKEKFEGGSEEKSLIAFIVPKNKITVEELRKDLMKTLPSYMIPSTFIQVEEIPLTPNGKVDREALSSTGEKLETSEKYVPPQNQLQQLIALAWKDVLNLDTIGIYDNFFDIGGNSIKMIQVINKLNHSFGIKCDVITLFHYNTINSFACYLEQNNKQKKLRMELEGKEEETLIRIENYIYEKYKIKAIYKKFQVDNNFYRVLYLIDCSIDLKKLVKDLKEKYKYLFPNYIKTIESKAQIIHEEKINCVNFSTALGLSENTIKPEEVEEQLNKNTLFSKLLTKNNLIRKYEVSPPQRAFLLNLESISKKNNIISFDFLYPIEFEEIKRILLEIVNKNSLLRSIILKNYDTYSVHEFDSFPNIEIPFVDLSNTSIENQKSIQIIIKRYLEQPFDVIENILYRLVAIKVNHSLCKLFIQFNHLIFDGGSILVLEEQLIRAQTEKDSIIKNKKKKIDYYDYSNFLSQQNYENIQLEDYLPVHKYLKILETVQEKSVTAEMRDDFFEINLSVLNSKFKDSYNEILFFSYARLIGDLYGLNNVPLIFYSYGRNYRDGKFSEIIGTFQDLIPVLICIDDNNDSNFDNQLENFLEYREYIKNANLNFSNFVLKKYQEKEEYLRLLSTPFKFNPMFGLYERYKLLSREKSFQTIRQLKLKNNQILFEVNASKDPQSDMLMMRFLHNTAFSTVKLKKLFIRHFYKLAKFYII